MIKLYKDTEIIIDDQENKISIVRGLWNFNQISLDISTLSNKEHIKELFKKLNKEGSIDENLFDEDIRNNFNDLEKMGLLRITKSDTCFDRNILFITDEEKYISDKIKTFIHKKQISLVGKNEFEEQYFSNNRLSDLKQNPLLEYDIRQKILNLIQQNNYSAINIFLTKSDDNFCQILNSLLTGVDKIEINFCVFDKDFSYLFGTKKLYTGCYSCFSKRIRSKMKFERMVQSFIPDRAECEKYSSHVLDFIYALFTYSMKEYLETGLSPMLGRIASVFNETLEIRYENLLRLSFCEECGYISRLENKERNVRLANYLKEKNNA